MNFIKFLSKYSKIEIPRLQRDYAQGREDIQASDIRESLLNDIFTKESISLNIIFGECNDDNKNSLPIFFPVDGQQRLTTLFLLYIFDWKINGKEINGLNKFTYETRHSTADFIEQIIMQPWPLDDIKKCGKISEAIMNREWFIWPWHEDPSVLGMLRMLDSIYEKCRELPFPDLDKVEFDFLDMGALELNETLYLKMNSRGKKLSNFEKIKSALDGHVEECKDIDVSEAFFIDNVRLVKEESFAEYWRWEMDRDWSDWFWSKETCQMDDNFLNLIRAFTIAFYANIAKFDTTQNGERIEDDNSRKLKQEVLSWSAIQSLWIKSSSKSTKSMEVDMAYMTLFFKELAGLLNRLIVGDGIYMAAWKTLFVNAKSLKIDEEYKVIASLWAISKFKGTSFNGEKFENWIRFSFNVINNYVEGFNSFVRFVKRCSEIYSEHSTNIIEWLASDNSKNIEQFAQWEEERIKAKCLLSDEIDSSVKQVILEAEGHPLFEGRIMPLILSKDIEIDERGIVKRWILFKEKFNNSGAKSVECAKAMRTIFSYLDINSLWWDRYVFQNTKNVWKNYLLKDAYKIGFSKFINEEKPKPLPVSDPLGVLCTLDVLEKVIKMDTDFYIHEPDYALRPKGNMWSGIRLDQRKILQSVKNLLEIPGLELKDPDVKNFYDKHHHNLIWGVRIEFLYKGHTLQLWDACKLWIGEFCLSDEYGSELHLYNPIENLSILLDKLISKVDAKI